MASLKTLVDADGRVCTRCLIYKSWDSFSLLKCSNTGHKAHCRECSAEAHRKYFIDEYVYANRSSDGVLKVGTSTKLVHYQCKRTVESFIAITGRDFPDCRTIWTYPGGVKLEAYIQAVAATLFDTPVIHSTGATRISEWFIVGQIPDEVLTGFLDRRVCEYQEFCGKASAYKRMAGG